MKIRRLMMLTLLIISGLHPFVFGELVEKIYAVVNGELITYSELKNAELEMTRVLAQQYKDEELKAQIDKMKKDLLDRLIDQKVILSFAREKNYDVDGNIEMIIKNIKKENNINSDEELQNAIAAQGMDYQEWKKQLKESHIQQRFIYQEIGAKLNIDNAAIMDYYKKNAEKYTTKAQYELNCIFLKKDNYPTDDAIKAKMSAIDAEMVQNGFIEAAKKYSELPVADNNYYLGDFKKGELDPKIEEAASVLKKDEHSPWINSDTGWYMIQLVKYTEPKLAEYKDVRDEIEDELRQKEQDAKMGEFIQQLKKQSHIQIYEKQ